MGFLKGARAEFWSYCAWVSYCQQVAGNIQYTDCLTDIITKYMSLYACTAVLLDARISSFDVDVSVGRWC